MTGTYVLLERHMQVEGDCSKSSKARGGSLIIKLTVLAPQSSKHMGAITLRGQSGIMLWVLNASWNAVFHRLMWLFFFLKCVYTFLHWWFLLFKSRWLNI